MRVTILELFLSCIALAEVSASANPSRVTNILPWTSRSPSRGRGSGESKKWKLQSFKPQDDCVKQLDLVLVVDGSGSIQEVNFDEVRRFLSQVIASLPVSKDGVHTSLVLYSSGSAVVWDFTAPMSADPEKARRRTAELIQPGGRTNTAKAFQQAYDLLFLTGSGARSHVPKVVLLLTDGMSNRPPDTLSAAQRLRDEGVVIVVLGVGKNINITECKRIVGCKPQERDCVLFRESEWDRLTENIQPLLKTVCAELPQDALCGDWSDWSPCSVTCGVGTQVSYREELRPAVDGSPTCPTCSPPKGRSCEEQGGLTRERECHLRDCRRDAGCGEWGSWGPWSQTCGNATRSRSRTPYNEPPATGGGRSCEEQDPPVYPTEAESKYLGRCSTEVYRLLEATPAHAERVLTCACTVWTPECVKGEWGPCGNCEHERGTRYRRMVEKTNALVTCGESYVETKACRDCFPVSTGVRGRKSEGAGATSGDYGSESEKKPQRSGDNARIGEGESRSATPSDTTDSRDGTLRNVHPHHPEGSPEAIIPGASPRGTRDEARVGEHGPVVDHQGSEDSRQPVKDEQTGSEDKSNVRRGEGQRQQEKGSDQPEQPGDKEKEDDGTPAAMIAGGIVGGLILAGTAAGGGYYYYKGGSLAPGSPATQYDEPACAREVLDEEKEAMVTVDGESNVWADSGKVSGTYHRMQVCQETTTQ